MMTNLYLMILIGIFILESCFEVVWYSQIRQIFVSSRRVEPTPRIRRVIKVENLWSWGSWIFLFLLFIVPAGYNFLIICIITLIETLVVYELYNAREYAKKINQK